MLLKVLHKPPRPIRIYMPKRKGEGIILMNHFLLWDPHIFKQPHNESYKHIVKAMKHIVKSINT